MFIFPWISHSYVTVHDDKVAGRKVTEIRRKKWLSVKEWHLGRPCLDGTNHTKSTWKQFRVFGNCSSKLGAVLVFFSHMFSRWNDTSRALWLVRNSHYIILFYEVQLSDYSVISTPATAEMPVQIMIRRTTTVLFKSFSPNNRQYKTWDAIEKQSSLNASQTEASRLIG